MLQIFWCIFYTYFGICFFQWLTWCKHVFIIIIIFIFIGIKVAKNEQNIYSKSWFEILIRLCLEISCFDQWSAKLFSYAISLVSSFRVIWYPRWMTGIIRWLTGLIWWLTGHIRYSHSSLHDKTSPLILQVLRSLFSNTLNVRMECKMIFFSPKMGFFKK